MMLRWLLLVIGLTVAHPVLGQGEDSQPSERDLAVIATMLPGLYDNSNQTYFEDRTKVIEALHHARRRVDISPLDSATAAFDIQLSEPTDEPSMAPVVYRAQLGHDDARGQVTMTITADGQSCAYTWAREAQQFRARSNGQCAELFAPQIVLGEQQLWWYAAASDQPADDGAFKLHRARTFECYIDMPGVGGGRDTPYTRYDNITLHDRGASHWIKTDDTPARHIGINLWLVDWPINNYKGVFTRDSLVISVLEKTDAGSVEHGYAFVEADAKRVGINLKWLLATCFMESNSVARPSM
ncbi:MAG: hypothetical protein AB8G16_19790 [Gammaproteobacteria bacterium]